MYIVVTMYYDTCTYGRGSRTYRRELLRESRRVNGKVVKRTVANVTDWPEAVKAALRAALGSDRGEGQPGGLSGRVAGQPGFSLCQGRSVGALYLLLEQARQLGLLQALGGERAGRLALWQVLARTQDQGSRLSAVRLARTQMVPELLDLDRFDEDDLYANLDWLCGRQQQIEDSLFRLRYREGTAPGLFLYDVTSTYLEGQCNGLAAFGYNRDGKRGKKQLVVGLLTDAEGWPLAIEVFRGNTNDPATVASQIRKLADRFGSADVTLVGDRGMLKSRQLADLAARHMHYITAITRPQIEGLLRAGHLQMELFDEQAAEVTDSAEAVRYIVRRNPKQAERMADRRDDQLAAVRRRIAQVNTYLTDHPRAKVETALRNLGAHLARLRLNAWVSVAADGRSVVLFLDEDDHAEAAKLDGCYVLKTDLKPEQASAHTIDARYRDLAQVEWAFRTCKTALLEIRPVHVRLESRTKGHALVVMLSYILIGRLTGLWQNLDITVEEGLKELRELCTVTVDIQGAARIEEIPTPRESSRKLLAAADVSLPAALATHPSSVDTKRKLTSRRKKR